MFTPTTHLPFALVLVAGGVVSCFFGHRLFRVVLALTGFILGAMMASSVFGVTDTAPMTVAALVGGLIGAALLFAAYFVGVALFGAGLGAATAHVFFAASDTAPHYLGVIILAVIGAALAMYVQRYVIIVGTAFGGAWTLIVGVMALLGNEAARTAATTSNVWVVYPLDPAPGQRWVQVIWVVLALAGMAVQLGWTGGDRGRVGKRRRK
jgi:hypothetical protein